MKKLLTILSLVAALGFTQSAQAEKTCWQNTNDSTDVVTTTPSDTNDDDSDPTNDFTDVQNIDTSGSGATVTSTTTYNCITGDTPNGPPTGGSGTVDWSHYQPSSDGETMTVSSQTRTYNADGSYQDSAPTIKRYKKIKCTKKIKNAKPAQQQQL